MNEADKLTEQLATVESSLRGIHWALKNWRIRYNTPELALRAVSEAANQALKEARPRA